MTDQIELPAAEPSALKRGMMAIGGSVLALFAIGFAVGYTKARLAHDSFGWKGVVGLMAAAALFFAGLWLVRRGLEGRLLAKSPRMREYQIIVIATALLGGVLGVMLQVSGIEAEQTGLAALSYEAPLSPGMAIAILCSFPILAWLYYRWHLTADEHEQAAYATGGLLALYVYFFASLGWWVAWRGGFVSEPDGFAIFWLVIAVWTVGWMWKRFR